MKNQELEKVVNDALQVVHNDVKFDRFNGYAEKIVENIDKKLYKPLKAKNGNGLQTYINIDNARQSKPEVSLRYFGQEVASLDSSLNVKPKDQQFESSFQWKSVEGTKFRKYYRDILAIDLRSQEHKDEFLILNELGKKKGALKSLKYIQPVKIDDCFKVQFPVGLNSEGNSSKGNIDILCRVRRGSISNLAVIELKNSESYLKRGSGIDQAIRYAVFLRELLRNSESINKVNWMKILKVNPNRLNRPLTFYATLMVPTNLQSLAYKLLSKYGSPMDYATYNFPNGDKIQVSSIYYTHQNDGIQITVVNGINEVELNII